MYFIYLFYFLGGRCNKNKLKFKYFIIDIRRCFALSDKKIKLHILSDPKNKIGISEYFIPADRGNNYVK